MQRKERAGTRKCRSRHIRAGMQRLDCQQGRGRTFVTTSCPALEVSRPPSQRLGWSHSVRAICAGNDRNLRAAGRRGAVRA